MARETTDVLFARYGPRFRGYVTTVALLGTVSAVVTTTSVNVALPDIMGSFENPWGQTPLKKQSKRWPRPNSEWGDLRT